MVALSAVQTFEMIIIATVIIMIGFRESTSPHNRQLSISIGVSRQQLDDFVEELTFENQLIDARWDLELCDGGIVGSPDLRDDHHRHPKVNFSTKLST